MVRRTIETRTGRAIRCIAFDLGETLWTHKDQDDTLSRAASQRALNILYKHCDAGTIQEAERQAQHSDFRLAVVSKTRALARATPGYEPDFARAVNETLPQFGLPPVERALAESMFEALRIPILTSRHLFDDTLTTLQELQRRGFLLGVVTNRHWGGPFFMQEVAQLGLLDYFDPQKMAISADLGCRKPNPEIFLHALHALDVTPEETAMVGDTLRSDIVGAKGLNMFAVWKPKLLQRTELQKILARDRQNHSEEALLAYVREQEELKYEQKFEPALPDVIITDLSELLAIFQEADTA